MLNAVVRTGQPHRAMYRAKEDAAKAPSGTEKWSLPDFADKASLAAALRGVDSVYLVCSPIPDLPQLEGNMIHARQSAGVRRIVLNSALGAGDYPKSFPRLAPQGGRQTDSHEAGLLHFAPKQYFAEHRGV